MNAAKGIALVMGRHFHDGMNNEKRRERHDVMRARFMALAEAGQTRAQIAEEMGMHVKSVDRYARDAGVVLVKTQRVRAPKGIQFTMSSILSKAWGPLP